MLFYVDIKFLTLYHRTWVYFIFIGETADRYESSYQYPENTFKCGSVDRVSGGRFE